MTTQLLKALKGVTFHASSVIFFETEDGHTVKFGLDLTGLSPGYYIQVWGPDNDPDEGDYIKDIDTRLYMAQELGDRVRILQVMKQYGVPECFCDDIAMDLPFRDPATGEPRWMK